ncbi:hypothetical protein GQ54DRAFT_179186 [Martensiomyces pterosporus]|nr:hypothetical protein GQ54DRAFT_179186 [Martensiomyces pterosporus]
MSSSPQPAPRSRGARAQTMRQLWRDSSAPSADPHSANGTAAHSAGSIPAGAPLNLQRQQLPRTYTFSDDLAHRPLASAIQPASPMQGNPAYRRTMAAAGPVEVPPQPQYLQEPPNSAHWLPAPAERRHSALTHRRRPRQSQELLPGDHRHHAKHSVAPDPTKIVDIPYVDINSEEHCCPICCDVFIDPCVLRPCDHVFCRRCIKRALGLHSSCPLCRTTATLRDIASPLRDLCQALDGLECRCVESRCSWSGPRRSLIPHLRRDCAFWLVACGTHPLYEGCPEVAPRHDLPAHRQNCPYRLVPCKLGCRGKFFSQPLMEAHCCDGCPLRKVECPHCGAVLLAHQAKAHKGTCHLEPIACPNRSLLSALPNSGCCAVFERQRLESHLKECPAAPLRGFASALEGYLMGLESRIQSLQLDREKDLQQMSRLVLSGNTEDTITATQLKDVVRFNPAITTVHAVYYAPGHAWQALLDGIIAAAAPLANPGAAGQSAALKQGEDAQNTRPIYSFAQYSDFSPPAGSLLGSLAAGPVPPAPPISNSRNTYFGHTSVLPVLPNITSLDLEGSKIESAGAVLLAKFLKDPVCTISVLRLPGNDIRDQGMEHLARAVEVSAVLERVDLSNNRIGDRGIDLLSRALSSGVPRLVELRLASNAVKTKGVKMLAKALCRRWSSGANSGVSQTQPAVAHSPPAPVRRPEMRFPDLAGSPPLGPPAQLAGAAGRRAAATHSSSFSDDLPLSIYHARQVDMGAADTSLQQEPRGRPIPIAVGSGTLAARPYSRDVRLSHAPGSREDMDSVFSMSAPAESQLVEGQLLFSLPGSGQYMSATQTTAESLDPSARPFQHYSLNDGNPATIGQTPAAAAAAASRPRMQNRGHTKLGRHAGPEAHLQIVDLSDNEISARGLGELAKLIRHPQSRLRELHLANNSIRGSLHAQAPAQQSEDAIGSGLEPRQPTEDEESTSGIRAFLSAIRAHPYRQASRLAEKSDGLSARNVSLCLIDLRHNRLDPQTVAALHDAADDLTELLASEGCLPSEQLSDTTINHCSLIRPQVTLLADDNSAYRSKPETHCSPGKHNDENLGLHTERFAGIGVLPSHRTAASSLGYLDAENSSEESADEFVDAEGAVHALSIQRSSAITEDDQAPGASMLDPMRVSFAADPDPSTMLSSDFRPAIHTMLGIGGHQELPGCAFSFAAQLPVPAALADGSVVEVPAPSSSPSSSSPSSSGENSNSDTVEGHRDGHGKKHRRRSQLGFAVGLSSDASANRPPTEASARTSSWSTSTGRTGSIATALKRRLSLTRREQT